MKVLENVELAKYTTIRIGGRANIMYVPETIDDLQLLNQEALKYVIGGGSNLLITDEDIPVVINLREIDKEIKFLGEGKFYVGASVRLQKMICSINENGYGGIEYLYSVPGLVGGAIFMNAGSGAKGEFIGNYIDEVKVWHNGEIKYFSKQQCVFEHRESIFKKEGGYVILGAYFSFPVQDQRISQMLIEQRIHLCKELQDTTRPNFGSVFRVSDPWIMNGIRKLKIGKRRGCHFSGKTPNWIVNEGNGSYKEVLWIMAIVKMLHFVLGKDCEEEVIKWE